VDLSAEPLYEIEPSVADEKKGAQKAARSLAAKVAKLHGAAPLPQAVTQLLAATETDAFKVVEIVRILETDPALAGSLIRQVNSAGGARVRCASIAQAVTLLGQNTLRSAALAAAALELFGADEEPIARAIVRDARRSALAARVLATKCGLGGDEMYTCALLHDVGKLMMLRGGDVDYPELLRTAAADHLHVAERERYGFDHALLAGHVLAAWKLPQNVSRVVAWHHQPSRAYKAKGQLPKMVALVRVADRLARMAETTSAEDASAVLHGMPAELNVLGFSTEALTQLAAELARELGPEGAPRGSLAPLPQAGPPTAPVLDEWLDEVRAEVAAAPPTPPLPSKKEAVAPREIARPAAVDRGSLLGPMLAVSAFVVGAVFGRLSGEPLRSPLEFGLSLGAAAVILAVVATLLRAKRGVSAPSPVVAAKPQAT
jgi:HD-like signal output (HDOD) protein